MTREQAKTEIMQIYMSLSEEKKQALDVLMAIPSAEPKTGHWIRMKAYEKWGCSECNTVFRFNFKEHNYCPNCGAKMVKPQESEDKG